MTLAPRRVVDFCDNVLNISAMLVIHVKQIEGAEVVAESIAIA